MIRLKNSLVFLAGLLFVVQGLPALEPARAQAPLEQPGEASRATVRVLVVGDSWAQLMWIANSLGEVFADEGYPDIQETGWNTAISGSTASEWATPGFLQLITDDLAAYPQVSAVQITMGGNDLLDGQSGGGWWAGMPADDEEALFQQVLGDLATVVDHTLALDPNLEIIVSLYDYPNFVDTIDYIWDPFGCEDRWHDLGEPTSLEIATAMTELQIRAAELVASRPRTSIVSHLGLMQWVYLGIPPPGDPSLPSPVGALLPLDCIHLSGDGYYAVAQNLWQGFYGEHFRIVFLDGFEGGDSTRWSAVTP